MYNSSDHVSIATVLAVIRTVFDFYVGALTFVTDRHFMIYASLLKPNSFSHIRHKLTDMPFHFIFVFGIHHKKYPSVE
jgi:uncharacterized membrane protein